MGLDVDSILGPGGSIARRLGNYEQRPQQMELARAVADALSNQKHLIAEAGTGVGKSFAYLVPAILFATADQDDSLEISPSVPRLPPKIAPIAKKTLLVLDRDALLSARILSRCKNS